MPSKNDIVKSLFSQWEELAAIGSRKNGFPGWRYRYTDSIQFLNGQWIISSQQFDTIRKEILGKVKEVTDKKKRECEYLLYCELSSLYIGLLNYPHVYTLEKLQESRAFIEALIPRVKNSKLVINARKLLELLPSSKEEHQDNSLSNFIGEHADGEKWSGILQLMSRLEAKIAPYQGDAYAEVKYNSTTKKINNKSLQDIKHNLDKEDKAWWRFFKYIPIIGSIIIWSTGVEKTRKAWVYQATVNFINDFKNKKIKTKSELDERLATITSKSDHLGMFSQLKKTVKNLSEELDVFNDGVECYCYDCQQVYDTKTAALVSAKLKKEKGASKKKLSINDFIEFTHNAMLDFKLALLDNAQGGNKPTLSKMYRNISTILHPDKLTDIVDYLPDDEYELVCDRYRQVSSEWQRWKELSQTQKGYFIESQAEVQELADWKLKKGIVEVEEGIDRLDANIEACFEELNQVSEEVNRKSKEQHDRRMEEIERDNAETIAKCDEAMAMLVELCKARNIDPGELLTNTSDSEAKAHEAEHLSDDDTIKEKEADDTSTDTERMQASTEIITSKKRAIGIVVDSAKSKQRPTNKSRPTTSEVEASPLPADIVHNCPMS